MGYPYWASKWASLVDVWVVVLYHHLAWGIHRTQPWGLYLGKLLRVLFTASNLPSILGWYAVLNPSSTPYLNNLDQNLLVKVLSLLDMIEFGISWYLKMFFRNNWAKVESVNGWDNGVKLLYFVDLPLLPINNYRIVMVDDSQWNP